MIGDDATNRVCVCTCDDSSDTTHNSASSITCGACSAFANARIVVLKSIADVGFVDDDDALLLLLLLVTIVVVVVVVVVALFFAALSTNSVYIVAKHNANIGIASAKLGNCFSVQ